MKKVAFCTTCKGRLTQLKQTLPINLKQLDDDSFIVILDYQSDDELHEYILTNFQRELIKGRLKFYSLVNDKKLNYTCAYAKNVVHLLADEADVLFNLDADNFILGTTLSDLRKIDDSFILIPKHGPQMQGSFGRLGYTYSTFLGLNGYDETIIGMGADDANLVRRGLKKELRIRSATDSSTAIQNTKEEKNKYTNMVDAVNPPVDYPLKWGVAVCKNMFGQTKSVGIFNT